MLWDISRQMLCSLMLRNVLRKGSDGPPATLFGGKQNQRFSNIHALTLPPARKTPDGLIVNLSGFVLSEELGEALMRRHQQIFYFQDPTLTPVLDETVANGRRRFTRDGST